jgi:hypothetical protein
MSLTDEDKNWITEKLREDRNQFTEELRAVETSLLTEFHKWASPSEARQRTHTAGADSDRFGDGGAVGTSR